MSKLYSILSAALTLGYANGAGRVPTVVIKGNDGEPLVINAEDYDEKEHKLWKGELPAAPEPDDEPAEPASNEPADVLVMKSGTGRNAKFYVRDSMAQPIVGEQAEALGIDENGYATEAEAWAAVKKA